MRYFSERELGESPREESDIDYNVWRGVLGIVRGRVSDGSFGAKYPEVCEDGHFVCGASMPRFVDAMLAEIPNLAIHVRARGRSTLDQLGSLDNWGAISTLDILDLVEFCWRNVSKATVVDEHEFFLHSHLEFDEAAGKDEFRNDVERIFRRNGLAYELTPNGRIERRAPAVFGDALANSDFNTGESELDRLLTAAKTKFLDPRPEIRRESLGALWDAWERLKTLDNGNKKAGIAALLDATVGGRSAKFRDALEKEARELTRIGNTFLIRHSETNQEKLESDEHVDYLFLRMFSLIHLIIRSRQRDSISPMED